MEQNDKLENVLKTHEGFRYYKFWSYVINDTEKCEKLGGGTQAECYFYGQQNGWRKFGEYL